MNMKILAIVIPYYRITFFRETLECLAVQTNQRFNVYIGNDASPENPDNLLKEFEGKFNFTYKKFADNLGGISLTKQWERCLNMMQDEEWFMILGDDDVLGNKVVESFYSHKEEINKISNVVRFSTQLIDENAEPLSKVWVQPKLENAIRSYWRKSIGQNRSTLSEFIFRKIKYDQFKFRAFYLAWSSDDLAVIDFSDGCPIFSINSEIIYIRLWRGSISGLEDNLKIKNNAIRESTKVLLRDYSKRMDAETRKFFIKTYDHLLFSSSIILVKDFIFLQYFTIRYAEFQMAMNQWKSMFHKLFN